MDSAPTAIIAELPSQLRIELTDYAVPNDGTRTCAGAKFHSPTPLVLHEVQTLDGPIHLCPACLANLRVLELVDPRDNWPLTRCFGNGIRKIWGKGL